MKEGVHYGYLQLPRIEKLMNEAQILGNGVSVTLTQIPVHFTVACNIPQHNIPYDVTTVIDTRVIDHIVEQQKVMTVWCTQVVRDYALKKQAPGVYTALLEPRHRKNSGHHAADQCARMGYHIIHLWGMDSMIKDDLTSQMDTIIPRPNRANMLMDWRQMWREVILAHPHTRFVLHTNQTTDSMHYGKNFEIFVHQGSMVQVVK